MDPLLGTMAVGVAGFLVLDALLFRRAWRRPSQVGAWCKAAANNGWMLDKLSPGEPFAAPVLTGHAGPLQVRIALRRGDDRAQIEIRGLSDLSIRRESLATANKKRHGQREIELGDPPFDDEWYIEGPAPLVFAVLGPKTRPRLARFLEGRVRVDAGSELEADVSLRGGVLAVRIGTGRLAGTRAEFAGILADVQNVAGLLVAPSDLGQQIAANFWREELAGVRLRALRVLARELPSHAATRQTLVAACKDDSDEVRLAAATALGADGRTTLYDLARDSSTTDAVAAGAVSALGDLLPLDLAAAVLSGALKDIEEAARHQVLAAPTRRDTACRCLEGLGRLGHVESEGLFLTALRSPDPEVKLAAARVLGRVGTVAAVTALREQMALDPDLLRSEGRQAIAGIQSRLSGAGSGQLSLASDRAGALSLAVGESGDLSLAEPERTDAGGPTSR